MPLWTPCSCCTLNVCLSSGWRRLAFHQCMLERYSITEEPYLWCAMHGATHCALLLRERGYRPSYPLPVACLQAGGISGHDYWRKHITVSLREAAMLAGESLKPHTHFFLDPVHSNNFTTRYSSKAPGECNALRDHLPPSSRQRRQVNRCLTTGLKNQCSQRGPNSFPKCREHKQLSRSFLVDCPRKLWPTATLAIA